MQFYDDLKLTVEHINDKIEKQIQSRTMRAANIITNTTKKVLSGSRSGKLYKRPHCKRKYRASAPGEAPAVRTGIFRRSFQRKSYIERKGNSLVAYALSESDLMVGSHLLGEVLDKGRKNGKMAARPYIEKTKQMALPEVQKIYNEPYQ